MSIEIKSKSQLRGFLNPLVARGKLSSLRVDEMVNAADLPEYIGDRDGRVRKRLGGFRQPTRYSRTRKGDSR